MSLSANPKPTAGSFSASVHPLTSTTRHQACRSARRSGTASTDEIGRRVSGQCLQEGSEKAHASAVSGEPRVDDGKQPFERRRLEQWRHVRKLSVASPPAAARRVPGSSRRAVQSMPASPLGAARLCGGAIRATVLANFPAVYTGSEASPRLIRRHT